MGTLIMMDASKCELHNIAASARLYPIEPYPKADTMGYLDIIKKVLRNLIKRMERPSGEIQLRDILDRLVT